MKIKMLAISASPAGVRQLHSVHDVPEAEGAALVAGGYAESLDVPPKAKTKGGKTEPPAPPPPPGNPDPNAGTSTENPPS